MNANERFEEYAKEFEQAFGYLPLGKDDPSRPSAERILGDLQSTWNKLRASKLEEAAKTKTNSGSIK
jgi:hypothetical protein